MRPHAGTNRGEWNGAATMLVCKIFYIIRFYGGAATATGIGQQSPAKKSRAARYRAAYSSADESVVLIRDRFRRASSWDRFQVNQQRLGAHPRRYDVKQGAPLGRGAALLKGLIRAAGAVGAYRCRGVRS